MTKNYCDRCKKETLYGNLFAVRVMFSVNMLRHVDAWEICRECKNELSNFMEEGEK